MDLENEEISYLRPRDPSLANESNKINLAQSKSQECSAKNQVPGSMQIYLRMKKSEEQSDEWYEVNEKTIICRAPGTEFEKRYKFSNIFTADSTQADLFNMVVKPKVFQFIGGKSSSLFAYGASGSGKTFTIMGTAAQPGIVPRMLEYLFKSLPNIPDNVSFKPDAMDNMVFLSPAAQEEQKKIHDQLLRASRSTIDKHHVQTYKAMQQRLSTEPSATVEEQDELLLGVWVSFVEIYNEDVFDLLKPQASKKKLAIKMSGTRPHIKDLTTVNTSNSLEAYQILQYGLHNLKYASTCVNFHSSRSHSIFTIKLIQGSMKTKEYNISYFNFCDLAGSERLKRTLNTGERLKESNSINTSLLVLGKCIRLILCSQKSKDNRLIPYRESKLTQLFQRALRGLEDIAMIVNVNPEKEVFEETLHALNFSAIAREVKVNNEVRIVKQMKNVTSQDEMNEIIELEELLLKLTDKLEVRESEFQDRMILMRSQMIGECSKAMALANKEYEKEAKRIRGYYEDLFEEELESWKKNYEEESPSVNENAIIVLDSSEDEEESPSVNENTIIVLDSSEDEESFKKSDLGKAAASPLEMQSETEDDNCEMTSSLETQTRINVDDESNSPNSDGKPSSEAQDDCKRGIKKSAPMLEEQQKTDEGGYDGEFKSKTSDNLVTESSADCSSELKEDKSKISKLSFELQDYSDDDNYEVELKKSISLLEEPQTKTINFSSNSISDDESVTESSAECSLFMEELNEAKIKMRESLLLFERQEYSDDDNYEVDVVETQAKYAEDGRDVYLRKPESASTSKSIDESMNKLESFDSKSDVEEFSEDNQMNIINEIFR